jgi:hypothetical protein
MSTTQRHCSLLSERTAELVEWCRSTLAGGPTPFNAAKIIARRLGVHFRDGVAEVGFWAPEVREQRVLDDDIFLEVFTPLSELRLQASAQQAAFRRELVPLVRHGEYLWGVVEGLTAGTRERLGSLYRVKYKHRDGHWRSLVDYLSYSVPFGAFAPAEAYDIERLQAQRGDLGYFSELGGQGGDEVVKQGPVGNILQLHVPTASAGGTFASLTNLYKSIANKLTRGQPLEPQEENFVAFEAIQPLPIEPTIEYEAGSPFWDEQDDDPTSDTVTVTLRRPDMTNWGYDILISGSAAVNPVLLRSDRPDELVDFVATLHNFPGRPIKFILDVVFGHNDNQAIPLMNRHFFAGANMYGQNLNFRHPVVRAILLEMQRRKVELAGADGIRVDGAQDFKWWDADAQVLRHDDDYLLAMSDIVQEVGVTRYRPWFIYEDGRPWPQEDWELSSTYRAIIDYHPDPDVFQWGPLTFAHNTPFLYTFWVSKWWRIQEILHRGSNWISGCANHDTLRRGTQVDPKSRINSRLGGTLLEIIDRAYDNPSTSLVTYGMFPGVPMEFINALARASWGFIRNTDDRYGVKVVSEEAISLHWQVDLAHWNRSGNFTRLKGMGFTDLDELKRFMRMLEGAVIVTDYDLEAIVKLLQAVDPPLAGPALSVGELKRIARAWMDDMHEYCNISYSQDLSPAQTAFNRALREFRLARPWLRANLGPDDVFDRRQPTDGSVVFYGLRNAPDGNERVLLAANMEGAPAAITPMALPIPGLNVEDWRVGLVTPGLELGSLDEPVTLHDGQGMLLIHSA